jgi:hypothetical protein
MHANLKAHAVRVGQSFHFAFDSAGARERPMFRALPGSVLRHAGSAVPLARPKRKGSGIGTAARYTASAAPGCSMQRALSGEPKRDRVARFLRRPNSIRGHSESPQFRFLFVSDFRSLWPFNRAPGRGSVNGGSVFRILFIGMFFCLWRSPRSTICRKCRWAPQIPPAAT